MISKNEERREEIRQMLESGLSGWAIHKKLGISQQTVSYYRRVLGFPALPSVAAPKAPAASPAVIQPPKPRKVPPAPKSRPVALPPGSVRVALPDEYMEDCRCKCGSVKLRGEPMCPTGMAGLKKCLD